MSSPVVVDVVSDVVCPWCYVGKRRLEAALRERPDATVTVRWHPFQLDPSIPPGGVDRARYLLNKFGSAARVEEIHSRLEEAGRAEGIAFAFSRITRAVNTLDAHRLIRWAGEAGVQGAVAEALMRAYFVDGGDIGSPTVLAGIADVCGMDAASVTARLAGDTDRPAVRGEIDAAVGIGVSGVPFFIFAQSFAVAGAQASSILALALDHAREHLDKPETMVATA